jgi:OmpA-OmpF porin, OOP family
LIIRSIKCNFNINSKKLKTITTMLRTLLYSFLIFSLWALFGRWYYVCRIKTEVCTCCESGMSAGGRLNTLRLTKEGGADILRGYDQFAFAEGSATPDMNANNEKFLKETAAYLKANPDAILTVTACSRATENTSYGPLRADAIQKYLLALGVNTAQTKTVPCVSDKNLSTAAAFSISSPNTMVTTPASTTPKQDDYLNISITDENFDFNSAIFHPKGDFVTKASQLKTYTVSHPNVSLTIVGHTDNVGNDAFNLRLGQRRADAVKTYFKKIGVNIKIASSSKGEAEPMSSNDTDAGRAQNRRVNCKIIQ